jgi:parallel beta-helix repeat protein
MGIAFKVTIAILSLLLVSVAYADIWYVHPDSALNSIQAGLDSCAATDTVLVGPGTYYENLIWPDVQSIVLMSEYGPDTTIIDGDSSGNVIYINVEVDSTTIIDGFTIQNGGVDGDGGGVYVSGDYSLENYSPTITNNIVTGNHSSALYGALSCIWSSPIIVDNTIIGNHGNGILCYASFGSIITGNTITGNTFNGIVSDLSGPVISENTITFNGHRGIECTNCSPRITGNTIEDNTSDGIFLFDSYSTIDHCTITRNHQGIVIGPTPLSSPEIHYNNIIDNDNYGVLSGDSIYIVNAEYNWWGDASGPGGFGPGTGDEVSEYVDYEPWLTDSVGVEEGEVVHDVSILTVSPNPFSDKTDIRWQMTDNSIVELRIYDITGRIVKDFFGQVSIIGDQSSVVWSGRDDSGNKLPSGVYLLKFTVGDYTETEKLLLLR